MQSDSSEAVGAGTVVVAAGDTNREENGAGAVKCLVWCQVFS